MYNSFTEGGMNCIDVKEFWATLKINWFRHSMYLWVDILKEELAPHSIATPSDNLDMADPVSYTHLTLPTIYSV